MSTFASLPGTVLPNSFTRSSSLSEIFRVSCVVQHRAHSLALAPAWIWGIDSVIGFYSQGNRNEK